MINAWNYVEVRLDRALSMDRSRLTVPEIDDSPIVKKNVIDYI